MEKLKMMPIQPEIPIRSFFNSTKGLVTYTEVFLALF
jgi:hypothetical protein